MHPISTWYLHMDELKDLWNTNQLEFHGTAEKYRNYYAFKELIDSCYDAEWIPYCKNYADVLVIPILPLIDGLYYPHLQTVSE